MNIPPTAAIHPGARIDDDVTIGPFSVIGENVRIESGTVIENNVTIVGHTTIGRNNHFFPGAVIGTQPQDLKFRGEPTRVEIGEGNTIREYVTVNVGTVHGGGVTRIGNHNLIMACCHVAHDCQLHDHIVMANGVLLAGHVVVQSHVVFGGLAAVHHFATIGRYAFVGGLTRVAKDVPPYMTIEGNPSKIWCVNSVGLKRHDFSAEVVSDIKRAHKLLFREEGDKTPVMQELLDDPTTTEEVREIVDFIKACEHGAKGRALEATRVPAHG